MKCPKCGIELSEPVFELHIANKWCDNKVKKAESKEKTLDKMNKEELLAKAKELEIVIEDVNISKAQIIELIKEKEATKE